MAKIIAVVLIVMVLAVAGFFLLKLNDVFPGLIPNLPPSPNAQKIPSQPIKSFTKELEVPLNQQNNSNQLGYAQITRSKDSISVKVTLKGMSTNAIQTANIYSGNCGNLGEKKYSLKDITKGLSQTDLKVSGDHLISQLPLAISVSKSATDNTPVACGDIQL